MRAYGGHGREKWGCSIADYACQVKLQRQWRETRDPDQLQ